MEIRITGTTHQRWMDVTHYDVKYNPQTVEEPERALDPHMTSAKIRRVGKNGYTATMNLTEEEAETLAAYCIAVGEAYPYVDREVQREYRTILRDGEKIASMLNG